MKAMIIPLVLSLLVGCGSVKPGTNGIEQSTSLAFIGNPFKYSDRISVKIDNNDFFPGDVCADLSEHPTGKVYDVPPGKHLITVKYKDVIIFSKHVVVKDHEMNNVVLP